MVRHERLVCRDRAKCLSSVSKAREADSFMRSGNVHLLRLRSVKVHRLKTVLKVFIAVLHCNSKGIRRDGGQPRPASAGPRRAKMAAPAEVAGEFESWLRGRLDSLEVDRDVYGVYILGVLQEEESDDEKMDALRGILSAFLDEDSLEGICEEIIRHWAHSSALRSAKNCHSEDEVQAIASMIEKQAQIVVKQKEVSRDEKRRKEALLAQYAQVTDEEDEDGGEDQSGAAAAFSGEKSLFKNTNVEDVLIKKKQQREEARAEAQKKKEQDKVQREKDKLAKQERKEKEKKRTQKGERKR